MEVAHKWSSPAPPIPSPTRGAHRGNGPPSGGSRDLSRNLSLSRSSSAVDMRQLTTALMDAREGTGEVRSVLLRASFKPRLPGITKILSKLSKEGGWRKALEVFEAVEQMGVVPDTALTNSAISACDKGGKWQKALEIFESMERLHLHRDAITYSALISALAKGKQWHIALQVFDHMQANNVEADVVTCCSLINALERGGQWQLAEKLFLQMCTVPSGNNPTGGGHIDELSTDGLVLNSDNTTLITPFSGGMASTASDGIVRTLMRSQTSPTSVLIAGQKKESGSDGMGNGTALIGESSGSGGELGGENGFTSLFAGVSMPSSSSDNDDLSSAFKKGVKITTPDTTTTSPTSPFATHLSTALTRGSSLASAFPQIPEEDNPHATVTPHNSLVSSPERGLGMQQTLQHSPSNTLRSYGSGGSSGGGSTRLQRTISGSSTALRKTLTNGPTHQAATAAHLRRAMSCYPDLDTSDGSNTGGGGSLAEMFTFSHAAKVTPNRVCCNALLAAYARAKPPQWQRATHLLAAMWGGGPSLTPDAVSYNTVLKACANSFQISRAMDVYREMINSSIMPNNTTLNTLIGAAADAGNGEAMKDIGVWLESAPGDVRIGCVNIYVAALVKVGLWEEALALYKSMLSSNSPLHPTSATFNSIMSGFSRQGNLPAVKTVFDEMIQSGLSPTIVTYNTLLSAQAGAGAWKEAMETLQRTLNARTEGINPNTHTFNAVLASMAKAISSSFPEDHPAIASAALHTYHQMQAGGGGATPDIATFVHLIKILSGAAHYPQALAIHEVCLSQGHSLDVDITVLVVKAAIACGQVQKAVGLVSGVHMQGMQIEAEVITSVLTACIKNSAWDQAVALCTSVYQAQGATSASAMFNFLLNSALSDNKYNTAVDIIHFMRSCSLDIDPEVLSVMDTMSLLAPSPEPAASAFGNSTMGSLTSLQQPPPPPMSSMSSLASQSSLGLPSQFSQSAFGALVVLPPPSPPPLERSLSSYGSMGGGSGTSNGMGMNIHNAARPPLPRAMSLPGHGHHHHQHPLPQHHNPQQFINQFDAYNQQQQGFNRAGSRGFVVPRSDSALSGGSSVSHQYSSGLPPAGRFQRQFSSGGNGGALPHALTLEDTNAMLSALSDHKDTAGTLEVLRNMKLAGITPDRFSYETAINTLVSSGQSHIAVELCQEGHACGCLSRYFITEEGIQGFVDLRDADVAVGLITLLTWIAKVMQCSQQRGVVVTDASVRFALTPSIGSSILALSVEEVVRLLVGAGCSVETVNRLMPIVVPAEAVQVYDHEQESEGTVSIVEMPTSVLYQAMH